MCSRWWAASTRPIPKSSAWRPPCPDSSTWSRRYGSLIRAARSGHAASPAAGDESGARYGLFATLTAGLGSLVERLVERLPAGSLRLSCGASYVARGASGQWLVQTAGGETLACDAVIVATGAPQASTLVANLDTELSGDLGRIEYAGTSIVVLAYRRKQISHPLDAFGFVVPAVERRRILAGSFSSVKFSGRAPEGTVLVRVFIGGACQSELAELPDDALRRSPPTSCANCLPSAAIRYLPK